MIIILLLFFFLYAWSFWLWRKKREFFLSRDPDILQLKRRLHVYFPEMARVAVMKGNASYTWNKKKIFICTRDPRTGRVYDDNMLTFVFLHELAHVLCPEVGHTPRFMSTFGALIDRAERVGVFNSRLPRPENYCV